MAPSKMRGLKGPWKALWHAPEDERAPLAKVLARSLPLVIGLAALTHYLGVHDWLLGWETYVLDSRLRCNAPRQSNDIVMITIDDADYRKEFGGKSPLDAAKLFGVVKKIVQAQPSVVGVDIDTEDESFAKHPDFPAKVIWARTASPIHEADPFSDDGARPTDGLFTCTSFLGGRFSEQTDALSLQTAPTSGVVLLPSDRDGIVRRYWRFLKVTKPEARGAEQKETVSVGSFCWLIAQQYRRTVRGGGNAETERRFATESKGQAEGRPDELPIINFGAGQRRFQRIPLSQFLANSKFTGPGSPLCDRIVLLGGTYKAAHDDCWTPVGRKHGVELLAEITGAELDGGFVEPTNHWTAFLIDILFAELLLCFNWRFSAWWVSYANLLLIPGFCIAGSLLAFSALAYWFNFVPVLLGAWIHWQWELSGELRALRAAWHKANRGTA